MSRKNQRKTVIVDGSTQLRIVVATSLPMIGCLVVATVVEVLYGRLVASGKIVSDGTIFGLPESRLGMLFLFVSAATVQLLTALLTSHKVAGTSYRIGQVLRQFREGDRAARVQLRSGDYQHGLAADVNSFLDWAQNGGEIASTSAPATTDAASEHALPSTPLAATSRDSRRRATDPAARKDR
ncbi:MAG: hypothetical protein U0167_05995 [bacterium]